MNYKIILFKCGCKYVWLNNKDRPYQTCPIHKRPVGAYILWCEDCGLKIIAAPKSGYRQHWCVECSKERQRKRVKTYWVDRYAGKYKKQPQRIEPPKPTQNELGEIALNACFQEVRERFKPPVLGGVV